MMTYALEKWAIAQCNSLNKAMDEINDGAYTKWWIANHSKTVPFVNGDWIINSDRDKKVCVIVNTKTNKIGISKPSLGREFSQTIGLGLCWAKCNNVEPPRFPKPVEIKPISELQLHEVFCEKGHEENLFEYMGKIEKANSDGRMNHPHIGVDLLTGKVHRFYGTWEACVYSDEDIERIKKGLEPV